MVDQRLSTADGFTRPPRGGIAALVFGLLIAAALAGDASAQTTSRGRGAIFVQVADVTGAPIEGAEVQLPILDVGFSIPHGGAFLIRDVPAGLYVLQARRIGFGVASRIVRVGVDTPTVRFTLQHVTTLDTVNVNASPTGWISEFDRHKRQGLGQFFTVNDIANSGSTRVSQFLRRARGILVQYPNGPGADRVTSMRCGELTVFLDGMPITPTSSGGAITYAPVSDGGGSGSASSSSGSSFGGPAVTLGQTAEFDINMIPLAIIAAIEVYTDVASIPARYRTGHDRCGTILIWTR